MNFQSVFGCMYHICLYYRGPRPGSCLSIALSYDTPRKPPSLWSWWNDTGDGNLRATVMTPALMTLICECENVEKFGLSFLCHATCRTTAWYFYVYATV